MVIGSFGLILGLRLGLIPVRADVDGPRHTVPGWWSCRHCGSVTLATCWQWRRAQQIFRFVDQLLLLLLLFEITEIAAALKRMAPFLVPAEAIHQIIARIFDVTGDGGHDLQKSVELLALGQVTAGQCRDPFLEEGSFILGLVGQAPMLGAAAHQAGVAIPQLQIGALEHPADRQA
jgi:hypothetical protein